MLPTQRRQAILAEVRQAKAVSADELARQFGVSLETIRRDLRGLRDQGLLERVYGGALSVRSTEGTSPPGAPCTPTRKRPSPGSPRRWSRPTTPSSSTSARPRSRWPGRCPRVPRPGADELGARGDGARRPGGDRAAAVRRAGPAGRRGLLRRAGRGVLRRLLRRQGVPRVRRRARPGRATDYHPPEVITRRRSSRTRPPRTSWPIEQARRHRRAPGLPAEPVTAVLTDHEASPEVIEALTEAGCTIRQAL